MSFDEREWVNDIVTGTLTGIICGLVGAMFVPDSPFRDAALAGGILSLLTGVLTAPLKWLLNRRPGVADESPRPQSVAPDEKEPRRDRDGAERETS